MKLLITGGAGFIGHHVVEHFLKHSDFEIVVLDRLNYAANGFDRLRDVNVYNDKRVKVLTPDLVHEISHGVAQEIGEDVEHIIHMAAETHVDNSIANARPFIMSNVVGTLTMLEFARTLPNLKRFVYFSTDEVFGPAPSGKAYKEWDRYNSGNPYAASKAGGEELCLAFHNTYKVPVVVTHTMNVYGERQHPEKFIPKCVNAILNGWIIPIHSNKTRTKSGSRFYIHARNVADALSFLLNKSVVGDKYNIVGEKEVSNLDLAKLIGRIMSLPALTEMMDYHSSRPGHDLRYALDGTKMKEAGWHHPLSFEESLRKTIHWMIDPVNAKWLNLKGENNVQARGCGESSREKFTSANSGRNY